MHGTGGDDSNSRDVRPTNPVLNGRASRYPAPMCPFVQSDGADVLLRVKVVPGARSEAIAGMLGDRLKVRVSAPPEDGKANAALCRLLARALELPARRVSIESGHGAREKTIRVADCAEDTVRARLT